MKRATLSWTSAAAPFVPAAWHGAQGQDFVDDFPGPAELSARVDLRADEVGLWCSLPAALSSQAIERRPPRLHLHVRPKSGGSKILDTDIDTLFISADGAFDLDAQVECVRIAPVLALRFAHTLRSNRPFELSACSRCGYASIAAGNCGAVQRCSNCGSDRVTAAIQCASTGAASAQVFRAPSRVLDLDHLDGCTYTIWASTPALIWTADRPQEVGIHVHADRGIERIVDETFASVRLDGKELDRSALLEAMIENTEFQS
jgi:hypothetical protein